VRRDAVWFLIVPLLIFAITVWASNGRLVQNGPQLTIFGDYDTFDLTYFGGIAIPLAHVREIPPPSPFYAGHRIIYQYFPLVFVTAVRWVSGASMLDAFLRFGWPFFTAVATGAVLALTRRLGSRPFAVISTLLVFTGSSAAYVSAWRSPDTVKFDPLIWSTLFSAPSAEWLYFNTWAPALAVIAVGLYAVTRLSEPAGRAWMVIGGFCFGTAFLFKSFAYLVLVPALAVTAAVFLLRKDAARQRMIGVAAGAVLFAVPWMIAVLPYNQAENRGAVLSLEPFSQVRKTIFKLEIADAIQAWIARLVPADPHLAIFFLVASVIFLVGGMGMRCLGVLRVVSAAIGRSGERHWTLLAWIVLIGAALPFVLAIAPFPNTIQPYQFALFLLWPFTVGVLWPPGAQLNVWRASATVLLIALSVPATVHYLVSARRAASTPPLATVSDGDFQVIRYLKRLDPAGTMLLHSNPLWPSFYAMEAERRVVLSWSSYAAGNGNPDIDRLSAEIDAFFGSPTKPGDPDPALLRRYQVTHVIERPASDRIDRRIRDQLKLVTGTDDVRLYEVPGYLRR